VDAHTFTKQAEKTLTTLCARKLMATVFWHRKGVEIVEFMQQETPITSEVYCVQSIKKKNCVGPFRIEGMEC
jgi:hypothetical protein